MDNLVFTQLKHIHWYKVRVYIENRLLMKVLGEFLISRIVLDLDHFIFLFHQVQDNVQSFDLF